MRKICCSVKMRADALVDLRRGRAIVAERLLQHDARGRRHQRVLRQAFADRREQVRRRRQKERAHVVARGPAAASRQPRRSHRSTWASILHVARACSANCCPALRVEVLAEVRLGSWPRTCARYSSRDSSLRADADDAGRRRQLAGAACADTAPAAACAWPGRRCRRTEPDRTSGEIACRYLHGGPECRGYVNQASCIRPANQCDARLLRCVSSSTRMRSSVSVRDRVPTPRSRHDRRGDSPRCSCRPPLAQNPARHDRIEDSP